MQIIAMRVDCARVSLEKTSVTRSDDFQDFKEEYQYIIEYTLKKAGFEGPTDDIVATFDYFSDVVDTLSVEVIHPEFYIIHLYSVYKFFFPF